MEITAQVQKELELFNRGRTRDKGVYLISMATEYRPYYALWREFPSPHSYLFVRTLGVTLDAASARAFPCCRTATYGWRPLITHSLNLITGHWTI